MPIVFLPPGHVQAVAPDGRVILRPGAVVTAMETLPHRLAAALARYERAAGPAAAGPALDRLRAEIAAAVSPAAYAGGVP